MLARRLNAVAPLKELSLSTHGDLRLSIEALSRHFIALQRISIRGEVHGSIIQTILES